MRALHFILPTFGVVSISLLFFSCKKEAIERTVHENHVVENNIIPP